MIDQVKNHYEVHIIIFDGFNNYLIKEAVESDEDSVKLEEVYERDIQQQGEGKGLNRRTPEHLAISDVSILIVTHYFDE